MLFFSKGKLSNCLGRFYAGKCVHVSFQFELIWLESPVSGVDDELDSCGCKRAFEYVMEQTGEN